MTSDRPSDPNPASMAVAPSPNSKASESAPGETQNKRKMVDSSGEEGAAMSDMKSDNPSSQPAKRNKDPGVRVIHGRIYDPQNGSTCHQCRQKTLDISVTCKNSAKTKPCPLKYCRKCLLNRYGEKTEDVTSMNEWNCPKCRGVCNCSICMKKRGHQPTGMLVQMAKAGGFSSVSDLLHVKGAENVSHYKSSKETGGSPRKGILITSPKKLGKENLFDGKTDSNSNTALSLVPSDKKKPKKKKRKGSEVTQDGSVPNDGLINEKTETKLKPEGLKETQSSVVVSHHLSDNKKVKKLKVEGSKDIKTDGLDNTIDQKTNPHLEAKKHSKAKKNALKLCNDSLEAAVSLPTGTELVTLAGIDILKEDAGNALQLLEFCATFGKILDVKKGQAEAVLRELMKGRGTRRGKYSLVIQFHIHLLSIIQSESESESDSPVSDLIHNNNSWLKALKNCVPKSRYISENIKIDCIDTKAGGYEELDSSSKLRLLNFVCDEVLGTEKVRNWIDDQNMKFAETRKEARDKLVAAKDKEKSLKQKMRDDIAKAVIAKDGVPLTIMEHDAVVSKIRKEAARAHDEMLACKRIVPMDKERPDAVRTEPIFRDTHGHVYWRLKGFSEKPDILHQDIGTGDHTVESTDKWFKYDEEQINVIEKNINVLRLRVRKGYKSFGHSMICAAMA